MKVKIVKVTDHNAEPKDERIWDSERELTVVGGVAFLVYLDDSRKVRRTSLVKELIIVDSLITITTLNSVYELEII